MQRVVNSCDPNLNQSEPQEGSKLAQRCLSMLGISLCMTGKKGFGEPAVAAQGLKSCKAQVLNDCTCTHILFNIGD